MCWASLVSVCTLFDEIMTVDGIINNDFSAMLCACYVVKVMFSIDIDHENPIILQIAFASIVYVFFEHTVNTNYSW